MNPKILKILTDLEKTISELNDNYSASRLTDYETLQSLRHTCIRLEDKIKEIILI